ncbi:hypothetical protein BJ742DRAFT_796316 [Cladochytrium replicatum]|nr:hypothetical protein BJ742DRAFT_796316 [Cladochytrium replicatum]
MGSPLFLVLFLAVTVSCSPVSSLSLLDNVSILKVDRPYEYDPYKGFSTEFRASNLIVNQLDAKFLSAQDANVSSPVAQPFVITFSCNLTATICNYARDGFASAGKRITSALTFYRPINIRANFYSFCGGRSASSCDLKDTLGQATAAAFIAARPAKSNDTDYYMYPQGLFKQLSINVDVKDSDYSDYDILAEFNSDFNFHYNSSGTPIQPNQVDFEYVVLHELTHGLGINTGWVSYASIGALNSIKPKADYLAPIPDFAGNSIATATVPGWLPLNIFDKFLVDSSTSTSIMRSVAARIFSFNPKNRKLADFISDFQNSGDPYAAAQSFYKLVTANTKTLSFAIPASKHNPNAQSAFLQTVRNKYLPGSSIAHVDYDTYWQTPDFLMIPAVQNLTGLTLDQIVLRYTPSTRPDPTFKVLPAYGNLTLGMLHAMGWPTKDAPERVSVEVMDSRMGTPTSAGWRKESRPSVAFGIAVALTLLFGSFSVI